MLLLELIRERGPDHIIPILQDCTITIVKQHREYV